MLERLWRSLTVMRTGWRRMRALYGERIMPVVILVVASIVAGLAEAGVLALVANVAAAMVVHTHRVGSDLGPLGLHLSIGFALGLSLALAAARLLLQLVIAWLPARISANVQARLRRGMFEAFTGTSWAVQSQDKEGHLQELMTDQINRVTNVVGELVAALSGSAMFLALVAAAFVLNAIVAVIVLVTAIALFWVLRPMARVGGRAARDASQANMDHAAAVSESVRLAEEIHVFGAVNATRDRVGKYIEAACDALFRYQLMGGLARGVYQGLVILLIVVGLSGLYLAHAGDLAELGAVVLMLVRSASYAQQFQGGYQSLAQALPYLDRLEAATARYRSADVPSGVLVLPTIETFDFESVSYSYRLGHPVLRELGFHVDAGEAIGIVGPSGAGKSTLVQVLLRLREPDSGEYLINGEPAASFRREDWHRRVAYVAQEPRIMHATVAENIRFFRTLDDAAVERAARLAHIHEDITRLPAAYDTVIGQVADALSGGQRQRICLARALAAEPSVLVLDEPTSALDMSSEAAIQESLAELQGQLTLFIVAHRISTISTCDRVLVLSEGAVESFAPASELELSSAFYQSASALMRGSA